MPRINEARIWREKLHNYLVESSSPHQSLRCSSLKRESPSDHPHWTGSKISLCKGFLVTRKWLLFLELDVWSRNISFHFILDQHELHVFENLAQYTHTHLTKNPSSHYLSLFVVLMLCADPLKLTHMRPLCLKMGREMQSTPVTCDNCSVPALTWVYVI